MLRVEQAETRFLAALNRAPTDVDLHAALGVSLLTQAKIPDASKAWANGKRQGTSDFLHYLEARLTHAKGDYNGALNIFRRFGSEPPTSHFPGAREFWMADSMFRLGGAENKLKAYALYDAAVTKDLFNPSYRAQAEICRKSINFFKRPEARKDFQPTRGPTFITNMSIGITTTW
jgi:hypothetical protein